MAFLRCKDPVRGEDRDIPLRKPLITIGRADGNDVVLSDPSLAPTHANLLRKGNHFTLSVVDRNTVFMVNGQKARSTDLKAGDEVGFGRFTVTLMEGEPRAASPSAPALAAIRTSEVSRLARLVEFSRDLMADGDKDRIFRKLLEAVVEITSAEKGFLIAFKDGERCLAAAHNVGKETLDLSRISVLGLMGLM